MSEAKKQTKRAPNLLKMFSELATQDLRGCQPEALAEMIYEVLAEDPKWAGDAFSLGRSEVHDRLMAGAAYVVSDRVKGVRAFCSLHDYELEQEGDVELGCEHCEIALEDAAADMAEARAMRMADCVAESGLDHFEDNYALILEAERERSQNESA